ncbi:MAG: tetratricopeptide repeat protein, partial [Acidobacteria bacterium]|nr:tetratricopeptide repeat protein [Acidobacteriota bacterium]
MRLLFIFLLAATTFAGLIAQAQAQASSGESVRQGVKLLQQGDLDGAINVLRAAVKQNKKDAAGWRYLGIALTRKEDAKGARKALETAIKLNPNDAASHADLAYVLLFSDKTTEAGVEAQQALALESLNPDAHYVLGVVNMRRSNPAEALAKANTALQLRPTFALAWLLKSQAILASHGKEISEAVSPLPASSPGPEEKKKNRLA